MTLFTLFKIQGLNAKEFYLLLYTIARRTLTLSPIMTLFTLFKIQGLNAKEFYLLLYTIALTTLTLSQFVTEVETEHGSIWNFSPRSELLLPHLLYTIIPIMIMIVLHF